MFTQRRIAPQSLLVALMLSAGVIAAAAFVHRAGAQQQDPCDFFDVGQMQVPPELDSIVGSLVRNPNDACGWSASSSGIAGQVVVLERTDVSDVSLNRTDLTRDNGCFAFTDLSPPDSTWRLAAPRSVVEAGLVVDCTSVGGDNEFIELSLANDGGSLIRVGYVGEGDPGSPGWLGWVAALVVALAALVVGFILLRRDHPRD